MDEIRQTIDRVTASDYWLRDHPPTLDLPLDVRIDPETALAVLLDRKDHLDVRPRDARFEPRTGAIVPERLASIRDTAVRSVSAGCPRGSIRSVLPPKSPTRWPATLRSPTLC